MKKTFNLFLALVVVALFANFSFAQNPTYNLRVDSMRLVSIVNEDDAIEFGIYLTHTNAPTPFGYAGGQYFLSFNQAIFPGCNISDTDNCAEYRIIGSQLPFGYPPRNPSVSTAANPTQTVLRLAINAFQGTPGHDITGVTDLLIARVRLRNMAPQTDATFNQANFDLAWRNPPVVAFSTKIFAYIADVNTDITTPQTHTINNTLPNPLPVNLASFTSTVNRNNVTLNWATSMELNNSGFDIERKLVSATDWTRIGNVAGNGTTNETRNYSFNERVSTGKYNYRLKQIDLNGNFAYHQLANEVEVGVPSVYAISQNYPNPFNPSTKIDFDIPYDGKVSIILYDMSGREVATLVNDVKPAGYYTQSFNASNLASGMYFYRITANGGNQNFVMTKKMVLIK
jgi:hypothetical protein